MVDGGLKPNNMPFAALKMEQATVSPDIVMPNIVIDSLCKDHWTEWLELKEIAYTTLIKHIGNTSPELLICGCFKKWNKQLVSLNTVSYNTVMYQRSVGAACYRNAFKLFSHD
ncbi:hypothetical protein RJ641_023408 [Dillenia turbinata]|uniref:Uncharacterized protein n=1 Tax=Dillenia turbinata TaxID=194707 RepID=A0AAN8U9H3_9MAGN